MISQVAINHILKILQNQARNDQLIEENKINNAANTLCVLKKITG